MLLPQEDLEYIHSRVLPFKDDLSDKSIFITGGTGFFGKWLLFSLNDFIEKNNLTTKLIVLSRNPESFIQRTGFEFSEDTVQFVQGQIDSFSYENSVDYVLHMATDANPELNKTHPEEQYRVILDGMKRVLDFAQEKSVKKFLFTSSGAIYGKHESKVVEDYKTDDSQMTSYAKAKRDCEKLGQEYDFPFLVARCFAFIGPHMPMSLSFAAGNFMQNALKGEDIIIKGDGKSVRSYMYMADLTVALLLIFFKSQESETYNVGSDEAVTIAEFAQKISDLHENSECKVLNEISGSSFYCPDVSKIKSFLSFHPRYNLDFSIQSTYKWLKCQDS